MCGSCYATYGKPVVVTERTPLAVQAIGKVYDASPSAGGCHIVLDDWNLETDWIDDVLAAGEITLDERVCLMLLREMAEDERATALAMYDGLIERTSA